MTPYFRDIAPATLCGTTVILDVDGTLLPDGGDRFDDATLSMLKSLAKGARIYLCSNTRHGARIRALAEAAGVLYVDSRYRKPNPKVLLGVAPSPEFPFSVVGDKYLTDGCLAARIRAPFTKVRTLSLGKESLYVRFTYLMDALLGRVTYQVIRILV